MDSYKKKKKSLYVSEKNSIFAEKDNLKITKPKL